MVHPPWVQKQAFGWVALRELGWMGFASCADGLGCIGKAEAVGPWLAAARFEMTSPLASPPLNIKTVTSSSQTTACTPVFKGALFLLPPCSGCFWHEADSPPPVLKSCYCPLHGLSTFGVSNPEFLSFSSF